MDPCILFHLKDCLKKMIQERVLSLECEQDVSKVQLKFVAPDSKFVDGLTSDPAINCYLIGLSEDMQRRQSEPHRSTLHLNKTMRVWKKEPRFVEVHYMITVWNKDPGSSADIEHIILGYLISGLGSLDFIPDDLLDEFDLNVQPYGIRMTLFGSTNSEKIGGQVWQAMESTPKPVLMLTLSVPVSVSPLKLVPVVREIERAVNPTTEENK
ncbi:Pvc16 family protein [Algicola sagamiensis]|uniref:Pvc16 family protein n=1 Tax=Algicola sagamiensis TaxID=163869 RepID=UPI00037650E4|nr:Pvc16 family protein [Algicola sagamiensis]